MFSVLKYHVIKKQNEKQHVLLIKIISHVLKINTLYYLAHVPNNKVTQF